MRNGFVYDWQLQEDHDEHTSKICMYTLLDENDDIAIVEVTNFQPFIYIELPTFIPIVFLNQRLGECTRKILEMARLHQDCLGQEYCKACQRGNMPWKGIFKFEWKRKMYHVQQDLWTPMLKMTFSTERQRQWSWRRLDGKMLSLVPYTFTLRIHEYKAPLVLQLCTSFHLPTTGWVTWPRDRFQKECNGIQMYRVKCEELKYNRDRVDTKFPRTVSIDIEAYSPNPKRMVDATRIEDVVFMIALVDYEQKERRLLHLGSIDSRRFLSLQIKSFSYRTEKDLLLGFVQHIQEMRPHILMGYNVFGFDFPYLMKRAEHYGIEKHISKLGWSEKVCLIRNISWSSSAYRHQHFCFWDMDGRLSMDLLPIIQRDYKFDNYRLKTVSSFFLGDTKDPITVKDIFDAYSFHLKNSSEAIQQMTKVGKYCIQDAELVSRLFEKLNLWIGLSEMAKICHVTIPNLYISGQQIKVYSQIYHYCHQHHIVVQSPPPEQTHMKYTGATVFPPIPGMYEWVIPFDFSSLYPTTIIAYNIDYSTFVPKERTDIKDEQCHVIEWEEHTGCEHDKTHYTATTRPTTIFCGKHFYRFLKSPIGVVPSILQQLLQARSTTKKQMKTLEKSNVFYHVLDKRQLAYKVSANSMYGAMGVVKGYLPFVVGAMCVTAKGRQSIEKASNVVKSWGGQIVYGDSVIGSTCVTIRHDVCQHIWCGPIEELYHILCKHEYACPCNECFWNPQSFQWKQQTDKKERCIIYGYSIWSSNGWTTLDYLYRHVCHKQIYPIWTDKGYVHVTEDHSLLDDHLSELSPKEWLKTRAVLCTFPFQNILSIPTTTTPYITIPKVVSLSTLLPNDEKRWFQIGFQASFYLQFALDGYFSNLLSLPDKVKSHLLYSFWDKEWIYSKGTFVWKGFLSGFHHSYSLELDRYPCSWQKCWQSNCKSSSISQHILQRMILLASFFGYEWNFINSLGGVFQKHSMSSSPTSTFSYSYSSQAVYKIENTHVYDVGTSNHHFQAGVGSIIVHNTDSIYCHFPLYHKNASLLWSKAKEIEQQLTPFFPPPMKLAFEDKLYSRFLILTKKRYMAYTCDENGIMDKELTIRGVLLARRDSCQWIRSSYEQIIRSLFEGMDHTHVDIQLSQIILQLFHRTIPVRSFVMTKLLGQEYAIRPFLWNEKKLKLRCQKWGWMLSTFPLDDLETYAHKHQLPVPRNESFSKEEWEVWSTHLRLFLTTPERLEHALQSFQFTTQFLATYVFRSQPCHAQLALRNAIRGKPIEVGTRMEFIMSRPFWKYIHDMITVDVSSRIEDPLVFLDMCPFYEIDVYYYMSTFQSAMDQVCQVVYQKPMVQPIIDVHIHYSRVLEQLHQHWYPTFSKKRCRSQHKK